MEGLEKQIHHLMVFIEHHGVLEKYEKRSIPISAIPTHQLVWRFPSGRLSINMFWGVGEQVRINIKFIRNFWKQTDYLLKEDKHPLIVADLKKWIEDMYDTALSENSYHEAVYGSSELKSILNQLGAMGSANRVQGN